VHPAQGRTASAGIIPDSKAIAQVPQGTCPRPPGAKPTPGQIGPTKVFSDANRWKNHGLMMSCLGRDVPPGPQPIPSGWGAHEQMENPPKLPAQSGEDPQNRIPSSTRLTLWTKPRTNFRRKKGKRGKCGILEFPGEWTSLSALNSGPVLPEPMGCLGLLPSLFPLRTVPPCR